MALENLSSEANCSGAAKIKTPFAKIIVGGTAEKPYYDIMWYGADGNLHIGYGSYFLENVFKWLSEEFEIVEAPTIDAVEVIRCKDCQHQKTCEHTRRLGINGYCSEGERRKE